MSLSLPRKLALDARKASSPLAWRLIIGAFWSLVGEAGSRALSFLAAVIVARVLGVLEFGAFALIQGTLAGFMTFAAFGMGQTTSRYVAYYRANDPLRIPELSSLSLAFSSFTGLLASGLLFAATPYIAVDILKAPELAAPLRSAAPILLFYAVTGAVNGTIIGFEAFKRLARIGWASSFVNFLALTLGASVWGLTGVVIGLVASEALRTALTIRLASNLMRENGFSLLASTGLREARVLWQFSLPSLLSGALHVPVFGVCQMLVGRHPNGIAELGLYDAAQKWMTLVTLVPMAASAVVGPVLASLSGAKAVSSHRNTTLTIAMLQAVTCGGPAVLVALAAPWAMRAFGEEFVAGSAVVVWLMMLAPISVAIRLLWQALLSIERAWLSLFLWLLWAAAAIALTWTWQTDGAVGLARAMLIAYSLTLIGYTAAMLWAWRK